MTGAAALALGLTSSAQAQTNEPPSAPTAHRSERRLVRSTGASGVWRASRSPNGCEVIKTGAQWVAQPLAGPLSNTFTAARTGTRSCQSVSRW